MSDELKIQMEEIAGMDKLVHLMTQLREVCEHQQKQLDHLANITKIQGAQIDNLSILQRIHEQRTKSLEVAGSLRPGSGAVDQREQRSS